MKTLLTVIFLLLGTPAAIAGAAIEHWTTANGVRVYFVAARHLPMLDVQVDIAAGSLFDPPGKAGLAALTRGVLDLGAGTRDENALAETLADLGARLGGGADTDRASLTLRTLTHPDKLSRALALLADVLRQPHFDEAVFQREQSRTVADLREALTRPDSLVGRHFWTALYPAHPYGQQATPEGIAQLRREDALRFHRQHYTAGNTQITLVGDLTRAQAEGIARQIAAALPPGPPSLLPAPPATPDGQTVRLPHPATQAHILIGLPAIERGHPDFFPLLVGNYSLGGGGFVSRLVQEVRDKRGFAYSVYSTFTPLRQRGPFQIGLQTRKAQAGEALAVIRQVLTDFVRHGPTEEELAAAKANLTGSFPLRLDSNAKLLANVANIGFYGLPLDYLDRYQANVQAVTAAQIRDAFARHLPVPRLTTVIVGAE